MANIKNLLFHQIIEHQANNFVCQIIFKYQSGLATIDLLLLATYLPVYFVYLLVVQAKNISVH